MKSSGVFWKKNNLSCVSAVEKGKDLWGQEDTRIDRNKRTRLHPDTSWLQGSPSMQAIPAIQARTSIQATKSIQATTCIRAFVFIFVGLGILQSFLSCATVPYVQKEEKVVKLVELINRGGVNEVPGLASTPFLIDGEIVLLQKDLGEFWDNLHKAGFSIRSPRVEQNRFATVQDAQYFRDSMEVRTFLKKYIDRDTSLVRIRSAEGTFYLLLGREVKGYPKMIGFGGPVQ